MDFGDAIRAMKDGKRVARSGWNGKGLWLSLVRQWSAVGVEHLGDPFVVVAPFIVMKTADDKLVPWLASQTDVLAVDWTIVDG